MANSGNSGSVSTQMICYVVVGRQVLLGLKKRGFGVGKWNGYGGKLEPGEGLIAATRRELQEEAHITVIAPEVRGLLLAESEDGTLLRHVSLLTTDSFTGRPEETEEMRPQWFPMDALPFEAMWPRDDEWLPRLLAGERLLVKCRFSRDNRLVGLDISPYNGP